MYALHCYAVYGMPRTRSRSEIKVHSPPGGPTALVTPRDPSTSSKGTWTLLAPTPITISEGTTGSLGNSMSIRTQGSWVLGHPASSPLWTGAFVRHPRRRPRWLTIVGGLVLKDSQCNLFRVYNLTICNELLDTRGLSDQYSSWSVLA